jgi:Tfp pilus assembly protein FimT
MPINKTNQKGVSIVEIILFITISLVVASLAISNFVSSKKIMTAENAMNQFESALNRARSDSIKRNAKTSAQQSFVSILNSNSYCISIDSNNNGTLESNETKIVTLPNTEGEKFITANTNYPLKISFDQRGRVTTKDLYNNTFTPAISYCTKNCSMDFFSTYVNTLNDNVYGLYVSPLGDTKVLKGVVKNAPSVFAPTITNVNTNSSIKSGSTIN